MKNKELIKLYAKYIQVSHLKFNYLKKTHGHIRDLISKLQTIQFLLRKHT